MPRFYLDLRAHRAAAASGETPVHPGDRGRLPGRRGAPPHGGRGRRRRSSPGTRRAPPRHAPASAALGFELFADQRHYSRTVTAAAVPDDLDWKAFNTDLKARGLVLAGGQGKLTGKIFRLGHLGSVTLEEILGAISTLEIVSLEHGRPVDARGRGGRGPARGPRPSTGIADACRSSGPPREGPRRGVRGHARASTSSRAQHDVDERIGCSREELARHPARLRRAHRPQPGPGRRRR